MIEGTNLENIESISIGGLKIDPSVIIPLSGGKGFGVEVEVKNIPFIENNRAIVAVYTKSGKAHSNIAFSDSRTNQPCD